ncbi:MAG: hypothetical protein RIF32_10910 [Leptospirales bacterium]
MRNNKRKILIGAGATIAALIVAVIIALRLSDSSDDPVSAKQTDPFADPSVIIPDLSSGIDEIERDQLLEDYRKWAVYPPDSRPLLNHQLDLIDHQIVERPYLDMPYITNARELQSSPFACRLQPHTHTVTEGEEMIVSLHCIRGNSRNPQGPPVDIQIRQYELNLITPNKKKGLPKTPVRIEGGAPEEAGTLAKIFRYQPTVAHHGPIELIVRFQLAGASQPFELRTGFYSSPVAPARFTGRFREELQNGSLVVHAEIDVKLKGEYRFYANLKNEEGYVAISKVEREMRTGQSWVPFMFFGRIFHDREAAGPFVMSGIRGYRDTFFIRPGELQGDAESVNAYLARQLERVHADEVSSADKDVIPFVKHEFKTRAYEVSEFSELEYDSIEKQDRLEEFS